MGLVTWKNGTVMGTVIAKIIPMSSTVPLIPARIMTFDAILDTVFSHSGDVMGRMIAVTTQMNTDVNTQPTRQPVPVIRLIVVMVVFTLNGFAMEKMTALMVEMNVDALLVSNYLTPVVHDFSGF